jgi:hypothetical protein
MVCPPEPAAIVVDARAAFAEPREDRRHRHGREADEERS